MILIALFGFIAVIVIALNMYDNSNLAKIEEHLKAQNCTSIIYARGSYKSLCDDKILEVSNSFSVDIEKNSKIYDYDKIKSIKTKDLNIIINDENEIKFSTQEELNEFKNNLEKRLK